MAEVDNRAALRIYVAGIGLVCLGLLTGAALVGEFSKALLAWGALTILFWIGEALGIGFHFGKTRIQVGTGESFLIPMLMELTFSQMMWGIPAATAASMLLRRIKAPIKYVYNVSTNVVAAALAWLVWNYLADEPSRLTGRNAVVGIIAICVYSLATALAMAGIVLLTEAKTFRVALIADSPTTLFNIGINVSFGLLFAAAYSGVRWSLLLFVIPLGLMHYGYRALIRQQQEEARVEQARAATRALAAEADLSNAVLGFLKAVADTVSAGETRVVVRSEEGDVWCGVRDGEAVADMQPLDGGPMAEVWEAIESRGQIDLNDPNFSDWKVGGAPHRSNLLAAPLTSGSELLGCLVAMNRVGADEFGPLDHQLLVAMADQLALALASRQYQRTLESRLDQAQRLEAIGRLAGGVAHEFNNLLSISQNYVRFVDETLEESDPRHGDLLEALAAGDRASTLTRQLLTFSRHEVTAPEVFNLNDVVAVTDKLLRRTIGEDIKVSTETAPDLWTVKLDRGQAEQVLMNLAVNARAAMPAGGELRIRTSNVIAEDIRDWPEHLDHSSYVALSVSDTGVGMSEDVRSRVFEPFFTTKPKGEGTGLGLSIVYGIIKQAEGDILVKSAPGEGTEFIIYLPRCTDDRSSEGREARAPESPAGLERIMIVEDEDGVREVARRILERHGYETVVAASGTEALSLIDSDARVDLLLTDVVMPGMSGKELVDRVRQKEPQIKAAFMSGYPDEQYGGDVLDGELIQKPFDTAELLTFIKRALNVDDSAAGSPTKS